jgi:hypothetical protein
MTSSLDISSLVYLNCAPMSNHFCLPYKLPTHTEEGTQPNGIFVWKAHTWPVGVNWATNISTEVQNPLVQTNIPSFGKGSRTPEGFNWWKFHPRMWTWKVHNVAMHCSDINCFQPSLKHLHLVDFKIAHFGVYVHPCPKKNNYKFIYQFVSCHLPISKQEK